MRRGGRKKAGFTLLECLIAATILALAVVAIAQAVSAGQMQTYAALYEDRANMLAETLMEEVLALPYRDPQGATAAGPDAGETGRVLFDNADDFHGFSESRGQAADAAGTLYPPDYQAFSRSVTAVYGSVDAGLGPVTGLTVTVTVQDAHGRSWVVSRFIPEPP